MTTTATAPRTFLHDGRRLAAVRDAARAGDPRFAPALERLRAQAEEALALGPWSVMDKPMTPPSGDKHDYLSLSIYWWPDPAKPDGLPYLRRDGEINPTAHASDKLPLEEMTAAVETLTLAWFFTGEARFAERAASLLRTWFLDPATAMNPHMKYSAVIPGICDGRFSGIVDFSLQSPTLANCLALLEGSDAWTATDAAAMRAWVGRYLDWLEEHPYGAQEAAEKNNHGTRYDVHVVILALFTGREELARRVLGEVPAHRIAVQIEPDGRQPEELLRTRGLIYSAANVEALFRLATMAAPLGIDLWHFQTPDGRGIQRALDWLLPYLTGEKKWDYQEITPPGPTFGWNFLRRAAEAYGDDKYERDLAKMPAESIARSRESLLYPPVAGW